MKKTILALACVAAMGSAATVRARTHDVSYGYRMGAGFPGDVNRSHPASILPGLMNSTNPCRLYGDAVVIDASTNSYRALLSTDTALTTIAGVLVRPYPVQQSTGGMSASIGAAVPPAGGVCDVLNEGFIIAKCNNFAASPPSKGGTVYIWIAASSGNHVQGGFEAASSASTIAITNARWNGPTDATGITEVQVMAA